MSPASFRICLSHTLRHAKRRGLSFATSLSAPPTTNPADVLNNLPNNHFTLWFFVAEGTNPEPVGWIGFASESGVWTDHSSSATSMDLLSAFRARRLSLLAARDSIRTLSRNI